MHPKFTRLILPCIFLLIYSVTNAQVQQADVAVKNYLRNQKVAKNVINSVVISKSYQDKSSGITHIYAHQQINGVSIIGADFALHTAGLKSIGVNQLLPLQSVKIISAFSLSASDAISKTFEAIGYKESRALTLKAAAVGKDQKTVFKRNESALWDVPVRKIYYYEAKTKQLSAAWEVQMMDVYKSHYWVVYVDAAKGDILKKTDLIMHCDFGNNTISDAAGNTKKIFNPEAEKSISISENSTDLNSVATGPANKYRVFNLPFENPIDAGATHQLVTNRGDALASPDGWQQIAGLGVPYQYTHGNNVWAFQDPSPGPIGGVPSADPTRTAYNNTLPGGLPAVLEPYKFDYPFNANKEPATYMKAAIVNLFYWNNLMHDVFYHFGFTEEGGNFQESNNFTTGLRGSPVDNLALDEVLAQAQDGGGTNNANFLTLPDGINGQMQMYLWTASTPDSLLKVVTSSDPLLHPGDKFYGVQGSFNALPTTNNNLYTNPVLNKPLVVVKASQLSTVGTPTEGCTTAQQSIALPPANDVTGKIVLIDRGTCSFAEKVLGAQEGGAAGAVVINNIDGPPLAMGGSDAPGNLINIPAIMITKEAGDELKALLAGGASINASLQRTSAPLPERDGDVDNGVIAHEYTHGISSRLTGGGTGDQLSPLGGDEQGGEGWSDYGALYITLRNNDLQTATTEHPNGILPTRSIGNYVTYQANDGPGIRPAPYSIDKSINPYTFSNIDDGGEITVPHGVGFIWCSMLYEVLQNFIDLYGINDNVYEGADPVTVNGIKQPNANAKGNNIAMRLIIEGMKLQPVSPTFQQQRDAILEADTLLYGGMHSCMIWKAFAKRGLGYSARSGSYGLGDEFEAFDEPLSCNRTQRRILITKSGPSTIINGGTYSYEVKVKNLYNKPLNNLIIKDTLASQLTFVSATGSPTVRKKILTFKTTLAALDSFTATITVKADAPTASQAIYVDDHEDGTAGWKTANIGLTGKWILKKDGAKASSGKNYWFAANVAEGGSNTTLATAKKYSITSNTVLVFKHSFNTEREYDGGLVEVSTDGLTWTYIPPSNFLQNGYNTIIPQLNNPLIGLEDEAAFSGAAGLQTSVVSLSDYAGSKVFIRFRFTCDAGGGSVAGGGWAIDDVYLLNNLVSVTNKAYGTTKNGEPYLKIEGTNVYDSTTAIVLAPVGAAAIASALPVQNIKAVIYPNPAKDRVNINISNTEGGDAYFTIYDNLGKNLGTFKAGNGKSISTSLNVSTMSSGNYWIEIKAGAKTNTYPLNIKR